MRTRFATAIQILIVILMAGSAEGQVKEPVAPAKYKKTQGRAEERTTRPSARATLPKPAVLSLSTLESRDLADMKKIPGGQNLGVHRSLSASGARYATDDDQQGMQVDGGWSSLPDGTRVWQLEINSEDAAGIRLHFTGFDVGTGRVWVHGGDTGRQSEFTGRGPWKNGDFWSGVIFSETAYVEYQPDPAGPVQESVPFEIREISHLWQVPEPDQGRQVAPRPPLPEGAKYLERADTIKSTPLLLRAFEGLLPAQSLETAPTEDSLTAVPRAAACQLDATCYPEWEATGDAVALILFESGGASFSCSGSLLNTRNSSFIPYFLTAAHCIDDGSVARTVESFWFFESTTCDGAEPNFNEVPSILGAQQVRRYGDFDDARGDFNLLLLKDVPDGVTFSGWDPNEVPSGTETTGIHHPHGEYKRIMFGVVSAGNPYGVSDAYLIVRERTGRTESGSSGSGLFTAPNVLVGALSFGPQVPSGFTVCDINPSYVGYGKFSEFYPEVQDYLEEVIPPPDGAEEILESGVSRTFELDQVFFPTLFTEPVYRIEVPEDALRVTVDLAAITESVDIDLHVRHGAVPEVVDGAIAADFSSVSSTGVEQVVIDSTTTPPLQPGTYYVAFSVWTQLVAVEAEVMATIEAESDPVAIPQLNATVHAGTQSSGSIAPGEIVTLYGTDIGPVVGVETDFTNEGVLPTYAGQTNVFINGIESPLFYVGKDQINVQVPYEVAGLEFVPLQVVHKGAPSNSMYLQVVPSRPGIFTYLDGSNRAVVVNEDGNLNSPSNAASQGSIVVFYATGEGVTEPPSISGAPAPTEAPFPKPVLPVVVEIGGANADVLFAGRAPGFVGVMQINARVPAGINVGSAVSLNLRVGNAQSPANSVLAIK